MGKNHLRLYNHQVEESEYKSRFVFSSHFFYPHHTASSRSAMQSPEKTAQSGKDIKALAPLPPFISCVALGRSCGFCSLSGLQRMAQPYSQLPPISMMGVEQRDRDTKISGYKFRWLEARQRK